MEKVPFSSEIKSFEKPTGDTNKIYYDPSRPDILIRIPGDQASKFLETEPKLIGIAEKIYRHFVEMGSDLDIDVAEHQFILAKETSDGPVKPMLIAKRIEGNPLVPIDKNNPKTLEAISRIAQLGLRYLSWAEVNQLKSIVTDIFRPDQYIAQPAKEGETHDRLTLVDIEPRLRDRNFATTYIDHELGMLVAPLRDSDHSGTFNMYMRYMLSELKQNRHRTTAGLINIIVNAPELYQRMSENFLAGKVTAFTSEDFRIIQNLQKTPLVISRELLKKFGIESL